MPFTSIPLFPLNVVVCPEGLITLNIFEARYLDMVRSCLRNQTSFVITAALPEGETDPVENFPFANIGTVMNIIDAEVSTIGLMTIQCMGQCRVLIQSYTSKPDGLLVGNVTDIPNDLSIEIPEDLQEVSEMLETLLDTGSPYETIDLNIPVAKPYKFGDASWVANRWVELLDLSLLDKQRLMQLDSPILRLELIQDFLDSGSINIA